MNVNYVLINSSDVVFHSFYTVSFYIVVDFDPSIVNE